MKETFINLRDRVLIQNTKIILYEESTNVLLNEKQSTIRDNELFE